MSQPGPPQHGPGSTGIPPHIPGPPYAPQVALVGGIPTPSIDIPICAVFIAIFLTGAACHMTIYRRNTARGHKFIPSIATFAFCMTRVLANVLRIAWSTHHGNANLAIVAQIFMAMGVLILFVINLLYAQRLLRAARPRIGWSGAATWFVRGLYVVIALNLIMVITTTVQSFYTLDMHARKIDMRFQWWAATYFVFFTALPLFVVLYLLMTPQRQPVEKFGTGSFGAKLAIVGVAAALLTLGAGFRDGTAFMPARRISDPAWYHHRACFYIFYFGIELSVVFLYFFARVDQRFYVPDGSSKVKNYTEKAIPSPHITSGDAEASSPTEKEKQKQGNDLGREVAVSSNSSV